MPWGKRPRVPAETLFWSKVDKSLGQGPKGECWLWQGGRRGSRVSRLSDTYYGGVNFKGKIMLAHRVAFLLTHETLRDEDLVLHSCDTPACVNPTHLFIGTQLVNMRDCWKKGRGFAPGNFPHQPAQGEQHGGSKLTLADVIAIRTAYKLSKGAWGTRRKLAKQFEVTDQNIGSIISRRTWKHV